MEHHSYVHLPAKSMLKGLQKGQQQLVGTAPPGHPSPGQVISSVLLGKPLSATAAVGLIPLPRQKGGLIS